ncbi:hypothetical protein ATY77_00320 [Rhizobium sp. R634]|nr:hypothetical protein ATY77_00320 [Rhizobium sp. R634]
MFEEHGEFAVQSRGLPNTIFWLTLSVLAAGPAVGQEIVTIPGYQAAPGIHRSYESERRIERDELAWGSSQKQVELGEFQQTMTVVSRDGRKMRTRWTSVARTPVDTYAYQPPKVLFFTTSDVLGAAPVELDGELSGLPTALAEPGDVRQRIGQVVSTASAAQEKTTSMRLLAELETDPGRAIDELIPGIGLLARNQAESSVTVKLGETWKVAHETSVQGMPVQAVTSGVWESIDRSSQTAVVTWSETVDADAMTKATQTGIEEIIALQQAKWNLTSERLAPLKKANLHSFGRAVVSLRDGSTIEATEVAIQEMAGLKSTMRTHIRQVDAITGSSDYDSRLRAAQLGQRERDEAMKAGMERSQASVGNMKQARGMPEKAGVEALLGSAGNDPAEADEPRLPEQLPEDVKYSAPLVLKIAAAAIVNVDGGDGLKLVLAPDSAIELGDFTMANIPRAIQVRVAGRPMPELHMNEPILGGEFNVFGGDIAELHTMAREASVPGAIFEIQAVPEDLPIEIAKVTVVNDPSSGPALDMTLTPASAALYRQFSKAGEGRTAEFRTRLLQPVGSLIIDRENDSGNIRLRDLPGGEATLRQLAEELWCYGGDQAGPRLGKAGFTPDCRAYPLKTDTPGVVLRLGATPLQLVLPAYFCGIMT